VVMAARSAVVAVIQMPQRHDSGRGGVCIGRDQQPCNVA
jgi:hypothetical protein